MDVRDTLIAKRDTLLAKQTRLDRHKHRDEPLPADFADQAVELENEESLAGIDAATRQELRQVQRALARLEAGEYGVCEDCGSAINPRRLEVMPEATLCVDCSGR